MARSEDEPGDDVPQEVGVAQDVLRLLERDGVEGEVDRARMLEPRREAMTGFADAAPVEAAASAKRERRREAIAALEQG